MTISNNRFLEVELVGQKISGLWLQTFSGISKNLAQFGQTLTSERLSELILLQ